MDLDYSFYNTSEVHTSFYVYLLLTTILSNRTYFSLSGMRLNNISHGSSHVFAVHGQTWALFSVP